MATETKTPKRPHGSSLSDFQPLKPAEEKLLECARLGSECELNNGKRPADDMPPGKARDAITIRSEFLRFLALGGDDEAPVHARGVQLSGAWIECEDCDGDANLDLDSCSIPHDLGIKSSIIDGYVTLMGAEARTLNFGGPHILGKDPNGDCILAEHLSTTGDVFFRNGFVAADTVRLLGASIGGNLECGGGSFNGKDVSIHCDRLKTTGTVFLNKSFVAAGMARLLSASIGGNLDCSGGSFNSKDISIACDGLMTTDGVLLNNGFVAASTVRLVSANIGGNLDCRGGSFEGEDVAIHFQDARISGILFLRGVQTFAGQLDLYRAKLGAIASDQESWAKVSSLVLDSAAYEAFVGDLTGRDARWWIRWLAKQPEIHRTVDFKPQPYEQLAKVLRAMGHEAEAKEILIEKQRLQRGAIKGGEGKWRFNYGRKARDELIRTRAAVEAWLSVAQKVYIDVGENGAEESIKKWHEAKSEEQTAAQKMAWHKRGSGNRPLPLWFWFVAEWRNLWCRHPLLWQNRRRRYLRKGIASPWHWSKFWFLDRYDRFLEETVGYGFKPFRALKFLFYIWGMGVGIYHLAGQYGVMTPTHPLIYLNQEIAEACGSNWVSNSSPAKENTSACKKLMPAEYTPFNPLIYSIDVGIPLVEFKQEADWSPRSTVPGGATDVFGKSVRFFQYFQIISGWVLSLLFVSAVSGIIRKD